MHAQSSYVCGNLFHHVVEMLLKADLAKSGASLEELQRMGHNLRRLWRAYKRDHLNAALSRHDLFARRAAAIRARSSQRLARTGCRQFGTNSSVELPLRAIV